MKWSEQFATGVERIDDQHKMLFRMSEDFRAALDEGRGEAVYGLLLEALDRYARSHFRFEEGCMESCRCPVAQLNKEAHADFVMILRRFDQGYVAAGYDPAQARDLTDTIDRWLAGHIGGIDVQMREWVGEQ